MIYQLPTGRIVYMSLEAYLSLTDEDIQYIISTGVGDSPNNPFHGSAIRKPRIEKDEDSYDESLDYEKDSDEIEVDRKINLDEIPDEDTID